MKKIFCLLAATLFSTLAMAQAGSLLVQNLTGCTVYYVVQGDFAPSCRITQSSSVLSLAPGMAVTFPNSAAIPGFPPGPLCSLVLAYGLDFAPGCSIGGNGYRAGEPCFGAPAASTFDVYTPSCTLCASGVTISWTPAPSPGAQALVRFQ